MPNSHNTCMALSTPDPSACMNCRKRSHSLLNHLSFDELVVLNKNKYGVFYKAGETICKEGTKPQGLLCLNEGKVKIAKQGVNGVEQIVGLKKPVDFIGFRALMGENNHLNSAVALEDCFICVIAKDDFYKVIHNNSHLAFKIFRLLAHELNKADLRMVNLTQKYVRARLADALLLVHDIYGADPKTGELKLALKRADLAALANMTTANAIRILSAFAKENLIEINHRKIKIKNLKAIKSISDSDGIN